MASSRTLDYIYMGGPLGEFTFMMHVFVVLLLLLNVKG